MLPPDVQNWVLQQLSTFDLAQIATTSRAVHNLYQARLSRGLQLFNAPVYPQRPSLILSRLMSESRRLGEARRLLEEVLRRPPATVPSSNLLASDDFWEASLCDWLTQERRNHGADDAKFTARRLRSAHRAQSTELRLRKLRLGTLPNVIGQLTHLTHVDLSGCTRLRTLPCAFDQLQNLEQLDLSGCAELSTLPDSIGSMAQLKQLDLHHCRTLRTLPESLGQLAQLQLLDLSACTGLQKLPESLGRLPRLRQLRMNDCIHVRKLPTSLAQLPQLQRLYLSGCTQLLTLPQDLGTLARLERLYLTGCPQLRHAPLPPGLFRSELRIFRGTC